MGVRRSRALALAAVVVLLGTAGAGWASTSYTFSTAAGWADWGNLTLTVDDSGDFAAPSSVVPWLSYVWEDYATSSDIPSGHDTYLQDYFVLEGILFNQSGGFHNFLVVLSADPGIYTTYPLGSPQPFWRGDLAINQKLGADGRPTWTPGGPNQAGLGVKTAGGHPGYAETDAEWGYQAGTYAGATPSELEWRDPYRNAGPNSRGYAPGEYQNYWWGSNFWHGTGTTVAAGDVLFYEPTTPIITGGDGDPTWALDTYAYQVSVSDTLMDQIGGFRSVGLANSCLNDSIFLRAPEPASLVLIGCAAGAGAWFRRRRKSA